MNLPEKKAEARAAIKERLSHLSEKDRHAESRSICRRILESLPQEPITICAYYPLKDEVDLRDLLQALLTRGDTVFLPRFEGGKMVFRKMETLDDLPPGQFQIPEPPISAELLDPLTLTIALVPARAFDRKGRRLGRGNGGYDIWIRAQRKVNAQTKFWGVALECQVLHEIPMEDHDERVDALVTARGIAHM